MRHYTYARHNGRPVVLINGWDFMEMTPDGPKEIGPCTDHVPLEYACFGKVLYDVCRRDLGTMLLRFGEYKWNDNPADALVWLILNKRFQDKFGGGECDMVEPYFGSGFCHGECGSCFVYNEEHGCSLYRMDFWDKKLFCEWLRPEFPYKHLGRFDGSKLSNFYEICHEALETGRWPENGFLSGLERAGDILARPWEFGVWLGQALRREDKAKLMAKKLMEAQICASYSSPVKEAFQRLSKLGQTQTGPTLASTSDWEFSLNQLP